MTIWYRIAFTWWCVISHLGYFEVRFKIANITHALPVPVHRQTDFTPKRVVVSRLHDAGARFRTGMKFSPRYNNRCKLTPRWLAHTRNFVGYHVNKCRVMWEGTGRSELAPARKSPQCHVNTLRSQVKISLLLLFVAWKSALKHFSSLSSLHTCVYIKWISRIRYPWDTTILTRMTTLGKRAAVTWWGQTIV